MIMDEISGRHMMAMVADPALASAGPLAVRLNEAGCEVLEARRLAEAGEIVTRHRLDYALLELRLDGVDALDLVRAIRALNPLARIIVHTWYADVSAAVAVTKAGADDLLPKPLDVKFVADFLISGISEDVSDIEGVRRRHIETIFAASGRNVSLASRRLLLNRRSLQRLIKRYDASPRTESPGLSSAIETLRFD